jgi:hypothetical protein
MCLKLEKDGRRNQKYFGGISILVLVFGVVFSLTIGSLVTLVATLLTNANRTEVFERALPMAQSGIEYYRWHLAHNPLDYKDGTNNNGPYLHQLTDPYGNTNGYFNLTITPPASGSSIITIQSQGWLASNPNTKRTVIAKYGIPSLAKYSFLHNANVWFGSGITVYGKVMSNGGIRMDGTNNSLVQSALNTYTCGTETGCSPSQSKAGVWGSGGPTALWRYPVPQVDFNSLSLDFTSLRAAAISKGGYLGPSGAFGYHMVFNADGTVRITKITNATTRRGWTPDNNCENLSQVISSESNVVTYDLATHPVIFAEDHIFVDGVVNGTATVVAARFPLNINYMNIWLNNNLTYLAKDGHSNLGLFAQNNIYLALNIPNNFEVDAALLAQGGRIVRHDYNYSGCSSYANAMRNNFTFYGSMISNLKSYWNYGSPTVSGFTTRTVTYDQNLYFQPPPYFPTQGAYEFISWQEL